VENKIKELTKLIGQLNKLLIKVLEFLGTLTLIEMAVKATPHNTKYCYGNAPKMACLRYEYFENWLCAVLP
jgi:hypothetical protein